MLKKSMCALGHIPSRALKLSVLCFSVAVPYAHAEVGDYSTWDTFKNYFTPQKANKPMTVADAAKLPVPYVAPRENFDDGFVPNRYNLWQEVTIDPATGAKCGDGSPYKIWVNRKPSTSNIQLSLAGGGACWDYDSCRRSTGDGGGVADNLFKAEEDKDLLAIVAATALDAGTALNAVSTGATAFLRDFDPNMDNKAQNWTKIYLPYCTGDVHIGLSTRIYTDPKGEGEPLTVHHNGVTNALQAAAWIRNNLEAPQQMMGNGISAGGIGVLALYHSLRKIIDVEQGYMVDDAGPAWFAQQGGERYENPSQFLHKNALLSWGTTEKRQLTDGTFRSFIDWYGSEMSGFDVNNFGTLNTAVANRWPNDRFGFMTTQEDLVFSAFSYRKFFPETLDTDNDTRRNNTLKLWQTDVNNFADNMNGVPNYGYYLPAARKFLVGHVLSALPDETADIQELGLTTDDFVDSIMETDKTIIKAKETDFEADRKQFNLLGEITNWFFKLTGI